MTPPIDLRLVRPVTGCGVPLPAGAEVILRGPERRIGVIQWLDPTWSVFFLGLLQQGHAVPMDPTLASGVSLAGGVLPPPLTGRVRPDYLRLLK